MLYLNKSYRPDFTIMDFMERYLTYKLTANLYDPLFIFW